MAASPVSPSAPSFSMDVNTSGDIAVLKCSGRLTYDCSERFRSQIKSLLAHTRHVHLDLADLHFIDSSGLGAVLSSYVSAKSAGCDLKLLNTSQQIKALLKMTHLASVFDTYGE